MSEERLERIETAMLAMQENMTTMQENMAIMQKNVIATQRNVESLREDTIAIRQRVDSIEGTVRVAIRDGLSSFGLYLDNLNITVSDTQREVRLLRRRVRRLEKSEDE
jgi:chromosome segregation ATPase